MAQAPMPRVSTSDLKRHVGSIATICGQVVSYHCPRPEMITFLDLDTPYWTEGVSVRIPLNVRPLFGRRVEDTYASRHVCATGRLAYSNNRYLVLVDQPDALRIEQEAEHTAPAFDPTAVRPCDAGVELPKLTREVKPSYTPGARHARLEGFVLLDGIVRTDGTVGEVRVVRSLDSGLDQEAIRAFEGWRFKTGTQNGRPVPVIVTVQIAFKLR
jgi:TonB family protein